MDRTPSQQLRLARPGPLALAFGLLATGALGCRWGWGRTIVGDGHPTTQLREVGGTFDAVESRGAIELRVKVGPAPSAAVTIDGNLQPYIDVRVEGSRLVIEQTEPLRWHGLACVDVTLPSLRAVSASGSGAVAVDGGPSAHPEPVEGRAEGRFSGPGTSLALSTSGSGSLRWHGEVARLAVSTSGSGGVVLAGRAGSVQVSTSGSGSVDGGALTVSEDADVSTSGSGRVELALAGGALRARTSGSGDVVYSGEARSVDASVSGSGRVRRR